MTMPSYEKTIKEEFIMKKVLKGLFIISSLLAWLELITCAVVMQRHEDDVKKWADEGDPFAVGYMSTRK